MHKNIYSKNYFIINIIKFLPVKIRQWCLKSCGRTQVAALTLAVFTYLRWFFPYYY